MMPRALYVLLLGCYAALLFSVASTLSMADFEVDFFYGNQSTLLYYPVQWIAHWLGQNDAVLRAFMIAVHLLTLYFYSYYSHFYLEKTRDRSWNLIIFVLLPGVVSSALLVHSAGLVLLFLTLFLCLFHKRPVIAWMLLPFYLFADASFFILFVALGVYAAVKQKYVLSAYAMVIATVSFALYGFDTNYMPKNYFLENFGVMSVVFSPLLFVYFIYTLFRFKQSDEKPLPWYLAMVAFWLVVLLSFRQPIPLEQFAPYIIMLLPMMIKLFMHSYRMRIRPLRRMHKIIFGMAMLFLIVNSMSIYLNKYLYLFLNDPAHHPLHHHHVVKELAATLHDRSIIEVQTPHRLLAKRLSFYGITTGNPKHILTYDECKNVTIRYYNVEIAHFCVTKKDTF